MLRISGDEFHDKSVTESTFEKYSEMITDENVQIKITDEITMFEYAGKGKEYIDHTKNPKYIKNLIAPLTEKYYIRFENNTLFCPIIISSNGNVAMFNCGAKEFIKIDELSLGNILYQSIKQMISKHNEQCLLSCLEYENLLFTKSALIRFDLTDEKDSDEDYYLAFMSYMIYNSILNARKKLKSLYPKLSPHKIIKLLPMPKDSFYSIIDLMNLIYNSLERNMRHYTHWQAAFLYDTDRELFDAYLQKESVIGIGMTKWICVIAALKHPDLIDKSCVKEFCDNSYLKFIFATDISNLIENKFKVDNTHITNYLLPCGKTPYTYGFCI